LSQREIIVSIAHRGGKSPSYWKKKNEDQLGEISFEETLEKMADPEDGAGPSKATN
jgi:hypothetical protein